MYRQLYQAIPERFEKMKIITPDYYSEFRCIADKCRHSCCIGWEIDIDEESYKYYTQLDADFGIRLRENINTDNMVPHFILGKNDRCPFLNSMNLCDIYTELGEDKLCQICSDHPRFRNFFADRTEIGLGLCCEAAGRLILGRDEKMKLECGEDEFSQFRQSLFNILQNRDKAVEERIEEMLEVCSISLPQIPYERWAKLYLHLERLDEAWTARLGALSEITEAKIASEWEIAFEQLAVYFIYRHLPDGLEDGRIAERAAFAALGIHIIKGMFSGCDELDELIEIARMYSSEIEYCESNTEALIALLEQY